MSPEQGHRAEDYDPRHVVAAENVLVELGQILAPYIDAVVVVGGWIPRLLFPEARPPHIGSTDIDLLLDPPKLTGLRYAKLLELLESNGYRKTDRPFKFQREVPLGGDQVVTVEVDFLVPHGVRRGKHGRFVEGFRAIEADGALLALSLRDIRTLDGVMPSGIHNKVRISHSDRRVVCRHEGSCPWRQAQGERCLRHCVLLAPLSWRKRCRGWSAEATPRRAGSPASTENSRREIQIAGRFRAR